MKNFRDIENLSAYLDGQLDERDAAQLETRLKTDPELDSILRDLRSAQGILRRLPSRKAPRNFILTRQMVGLKPPLPRSYPLIRFATVFAAILFLCSFTTNMLTPRFSFGFGAAAPAPVGGMGGGCEEPCEEAATEAPAAEEPMLEMAPAATEAPPSVEETPAQQDMATLPTATPDTSRIAPTPSLKESETQPTAESPAAGTEIQPEVPPEPPPSFNWTLLFLVAALFGGVILWTMRQSAKRKWR